MVERAHDAVSALKGASAVVMATEWPEYRQVHPNDIITAAPGIVVLDANRFLAHLIGYAGLHYVAVGMPSDVHRCSAGRQ